MLSVLLRNNLHLSFYHELHRRYNCFDFGSQLLVIFYWIRGKRKWELKWLAHINFPVSVSGPTTDQAWLNSPFPQRGGVQLKIHHLGNRTKVVPTPYLRPWPRRRSLPHWPWIPYKCRAQSHTLYPVLLVKTDSNHQPILRWRGWAHSYWPVFVPPFSFHPPALQSCHKNMRHCSSLETPSSMQETMSLSMHPRQTSGHTGRPSSSTPPVEFPMAVLSPTSLVKNYIFFISTD